MAACLNDRPFFSSRACAIGAAQHSPPVMKSTPSAVRLLLPVLLAGWQGAGHAQDEPSLPSAVQDSMFQRLAAEPELNDASGKWKGSLGASLTMRRGSSSSTEGSLSMDASRVVSDSRLTATALAVRGSSNGERSDDTANGEFRGERRIDNSLFGFAGIGAERDALQDMTFRSSISTGIGTRWIESDTTSLNLYGGLAYSMERYTTGENPKGFEPLLGTELRHELSETARITHRLIVYPDSVSGGTRFATQADITTRITDHLGLQLSVLHKYREKVRNENSHFDTVFFTGITAGF